MDLGYAGRPKFPPTPTLLYHHHQYYQLFSKLIYTTNLCHHEYCQLLVLVSKLLFPVVGGPRVGLE